MKNKEVKKEKAVEKKIVSLFEIILIPSAILIAYTILTSTLQK